jgi:hypothetical protein
LAEEGHILQIIVVDGGAGGVGPEVACHAETVAIRDQDAAIISRSVPALHFFFFFFLEKSN